jgi:hypothetical protein
LAPPGITITTGPNEYVLFKTMQLVKFDGTRWVRSGEPLALQ